MFVFDLDDIPATCHNRVAFGRPSGAPAPGSASHRDIARWPTDMDHPRSFYVGLATLEMQVVIPTILRLVELRPSRPEPERFDVLGVTLVPSRGGELVVERHLTSADPSPVTVGALS